MSDLTKWPRLIVVGQKVTEEQANEILIRTNAWQWIGGNDPAWEAQVREITQAPSEDWYGEGPEKVRAGWARQQEFYKSLRMIELEYLNNSRIYSSWIGGPHGWCDWDGTIGCSNYNIGKWPDVDQVRDEWKLIAAAFPFLCLTAQLVPNEGESPEAVVTFTVANGGVHVSEKRSEIIRPVIEMDVPEILRTVFSPGGERGVSPARLAAAVAQVRGAS